MQLSAGPLCSSKRYRDVDSSPSLVVEEEAGQQAEGFHGENWGICSLSMSLQVS